MARLSETRPATAGIDPQMQVNPSQLSSDPNHLINQPPPQDGRPGYGRDPTSHAQGGGITTVTGPNPGNGDTGYITAQPGEFVLNRAATTHYGAAALHALNTGQVDPQKLWKAVIPPPTPNAPSSQARH